MWNTFKKLEISFLIGCKNLMWKIDSTYFFFGNIFEPVN
jgi:hypothetical protein